MYTPLENKVAIVTGAGTGIGRAIALKLAQHGASVVATDISEEAAERTSKELEKPLNQHHGYKKMDVRDRPNIASVFKEIYDEYGSIDILINNAGVSTMNNFQDLTEEEYDFNLDINLKGVFNCCQLVFPYMADKPTLGRIVNSSSCCAFRSAAYQTHYAASKWGVMGLTNNIAIEYGPHNITCNCICPGYVDTGMQTREIGWEGKLRGMTAKEVNDEHIRMTPLGRLCQPEDVAKGVAFLVGPEADFITGEALDISGGISVL